MSLSPLCVADTVRRAVREVQVVDVHTHVFPPSHGDLMLWGIDALLTYHYLVAELFMVMPPSQMTPERFFELPVTEQADLVWATLFCDRTPLSEATHGVVTVLRELNLLAEMNTAKTTRSLAPIRAYFASVDKEEHVKNVMHLAGVKYLVMTNIPFDNNEAQHWKENKPVPDFFRPALRVDSLLKGDWTAIVQTLTAEGYKPTINGCIEFLQQWVDKMKPVYLMASTPTGFSLAESDSDNPNSGAYLVQNVLVPLARKNNLALAIKVGANRQVNPRLQLGGDGVEVANLSCVTFLCSKYPDLKVLVTVLSRENQHELCVLARKFGNLHLYGCWWFCNNPSIIDQTTRMRLEMLGTAFTCQHSDARVLEQLIYKWRHSRCTISSALTDQYQRLIASGWTVTAEDVRRDVALLFGGSYEQFLAKK